MPYIKKSKCYVHDNSSGSLHLIRNMNVYNTTLYPLNIRSSRSQRRNARWESEQRSRLTLNARMWCGVSRRIPLTEYLLYSESDPRESLLQDE